jgi:hypothetical protein
MRDHLLANVTDAQRAAIDTDEPLDISDACRKEP